MPSNIILKALGLNTNPNRLNQPDGSLLTADNVVIQKDNIIESRRGFQLFGESFGESSDTLKQLLVYKDRIIRHYNNVLQYEASYNTTDGTRVFKTFDGEYTEAEPNVRIKSIESNGNLYFTTDNGIKKISAATADDLTEDAGYIKKAGGIKALDLVGNVNINDGDNTSFFTNDGKYAYRTVWAYYDKNDVLIQGDPSERIEVSNPLLGLLIRDYMRILNLLDRAGHTATTNADVSGYLIDNKDYVSTLKLPYTATSEDVYNSITSLAEKLDEDFIYADANSGKQADMNGENYSVTDGVATINFAASLPNFWTVLDWIYINGIDPSINGKQQIAEIGTDYIKFQTTSPNIAPTAIPVGAGTTIVSYNYRKAIENIQIPASSATHANNESLQAGMQAIITRIQSEDTDAINTTLLDDYFPLTFAFTNAAFSVDLTIRIPDGVTTDYFLQVYRSLISLTTEDGVFATENTPSDELQLFYEKPITAILGSTTITPGETFTITDKSPDRLAGAYLYTNATSGDGTIQANSRPPLCTDIARFKNVIFYSNTTVRHNMFITLLGVTNMVDDYNNTIIPTLTITNTDGSVNNYTFTKGVQNSTLIETVADSGGSLNNVYFTFHTGNDLKKYYVWYNVNDSGTDPAVVGATGIEVLLDTNDADNIVASKTVDALNCLPWDVIATIPDGGTPERFRLTNVQYGYCTATDMESSGFSIISSIEGKGEDAANKEILLSPIDNTDLTITEGIAVDETARSIERVINANSDEVVYAFYAPTSSQLPGKLFLETKEIDSPKFYVIGNNVNTGGSFTPDISPNITPAISAISVANPTNLTCISHGLQTGNHIIITSSDSTPTINGYYEVTKIDNDTFSIPVNVSNDGAGTAYFTLASETESSSNEVKPNRIYYSKYLQPEAVPILNFIDVGAQDKAILRIFALKESLFIFKEDGLFRISGEIAPFTLSSFDSSAILLAKDSLGLLGNTIYAWCTRSICVISEAGVEDIGKPIDNDLKTLASINYTNFKTATFGYGYDSDLSYNVFTVNNKTDTYATQSYRYSNLTRSWTTTSLTATCGGVHPSQDKVYLGAGDTNYIQQERKSFDRTDYADRVLPYNITEGNYINGVITVAESENLSEGDVVLQNQYLTCHKYNNLLLSLDKQDIITDKTYYKTLKSVAGDDLRAKLADLDPDIGLAKRLDTDLGYVAPDSFSYAIDSYTGFILSIAPGTDTVEITTTAAHKLVTGRYVNIVDTDCTPNIDGDYVVTVTSSTTFTIEPMQPVLIAGGHVGSFSTNNTEALDIKGCFNKIVTMLNEDVQFTFSSYPVIDSITPLESVITNVDQSTGALTLNNALDYVVGDFSVFKAIRSSIEYSPVSLGEPLTWKHIREAVLMFISKAFTKAYISFASDLIPKFTEIAFYGHGNGLYGNNVKFGKGYFGGASSGASTRTYIPRNNQRCRYLLVKFRHQVAREQYSLEGIGLTGESNLSSRAYR